MQAQAGHGGHAKLMQALGHVLFSKLPPQVGTDYLVVGIGTLWAVLLYV